MRSLYLFHLPNRLWKVKIYIMIFFEKIMVFN